MTVTSSTNYVEKKKHKNTFKIKAKLETKKKNRKSFKFKGKVIVWSYGYEKESFESAWRFVRVPEEISAKIIELQKDKLRRGFGAVYAKAKVGKTEWLTSIFPDWYSPIYILPLKKKIRYEENLYDGRSIKVSIEIWF